MMLINRLREPDYDAFAKAVVIGTACSVGRRLVNTIPNSVRARLGIGDD